VAPSPIVKTPVTPTIEPAKTPSKEASLPVDLPVQKNEGIPPPDNINSGNNTPILNNTTINKEELFSFSFSIRLLK
jgi:hypothetical protein